MLKLRITVVFLLSLSGNLSFALLATAPLSQLGRIQSAINAFAQINGRLPCPAQATSSRSSSDFGLETGGMGICHEGAATFNPGDQNEISAGVLPVRTLGLSDDDVFDATGNSIGYFVQTTATLRTDCSIAIPAYLTLLNGATGPAQNQNISLDLCRVSTVSPLPSTACDPSSTACAPLSSGPGMLMMTLADPTHSLFSRGTDAPSYQADITCDSETPNTQATTFSGVNLTADGDNEDVALPLPAGGYQCTLSVYQTGDSSHPIGSGSSTAIQVSPQGSITASITILGGQYGDLGAAIK